MNGLSFNQDNEQQAAAQRDHAPNGGLEAFTKSREHDADQTETYGNQAEDGEDNEQKRDCLARRPRQADVDPCIQQRSGIGHSLKPHAVTITILVLAALSANIINFLVYTGTYIGLVLLLTVAVFFGRDRRLLARLMDEHRQNVVDGLRHLMMGLYCLASLAAVLAHKAYLWDILGVEGVFAAILCAQYDLGIRLRRRAARSEGRAS